MRTLQICSIYHEIASSENPSKYNLENFIENALKNQKFKCNRKKQSQQFHQNVTLYIRCSMNNYFPKSVRQQSQTGITIEKSCKKIMPLKSVDSVERKMGMN